MQKIAVVTGGSKGIGLAIVKKLLSEDFKVISASRTIGALEQLRVNYGENLLIHNLDLIKPDALKLFVEFVKSNTVRIDLLVNNAGIFLPGEIHNEMEENYELQMQLNVTVPYRLTRALLPLMMPFNEGYIFNICSTASIMAYSDGGSYCVSKHALLGFSKVLRKEMMPYNIGVSSILPGATYTESWVGTDLPESRFIKADSIAEALWYAWQQRDNMVMEEIMMRPMSGDL